MAGAVGSLNVSVAAGVALFEAARTAWIGVPPGRVGDLGGTGSSTEAPFEG